MSAYTALCHALDGAHPIAKAHPAERRDWAADVLDLRVVEAIRHLEQLHDNPDTDEMYHAGLRMAIRALRDLRSNEED